jgi:glycosyltransferase involved in cell wall biosynthesis
MKLSVIIPAYNEAQTIGRILKRVLDINVGNLTKEIVVINDGSLDGTLMEIKNIKDKRIVIYDKKTNEGKGAAIRDGIKRSSGDIVLIQDADLEYDPGEYPLLLEPILSGKADVVFGSRFTSSRAHRVLFFWHMLGNKFLTLLTNAVTNMNYTDMETCYKVFTREIAGEITFEENRFGFEPEFAIKTARTGARIYEVGISYAGRSYAEGKKINWKDGVKAIWCIFKYGVLA